jgi:hypothetical protein
MKLKKLKHNEIIWDLFDKTNSFIDEIKPLLNRFLEDEYSFVIGIFGKNYKKMCLLYHKNVREFEGYSIKLSDKYHKNIQNFEIISSFITTNTFEVYNINTHKFIESSMKDCYNSFYKKRELYYITSRELIK